MSKFRKTQPGVSLYLTIVILAIVLSLALGAATLLFYQIRILRDIGYSVISYYAAETGIERALYGLFQGELGPQWQETLSNNASYVVIFLNPGEGGCPATALNYCLKSIGTYQDIKRGIRIAR